MTTGVRAKGAKRIQFDIAVDGVRHRPTLARVPTEANLRRAAKQLQEIKSRIANGAFNFAEEFPEFRFLERIAGARGPRTCNNVFDEFMAHCESRMPKNDMAYATVDSYRKILDSIWRPALGSASFESVKYSTLLRIADAQHAAKKTYNNILSPLRCAFDYGYRDHPEKPNPAAGLKGFPITKIERPVIDPFFIQEAESLMVRNNPLWVAKQHGHSVHTMLEAYAAWIEGAKDGDIDAIKQSMLSPVAKSIRVQTLVENVVCSARFGTSPHEPTAKSQTHKGKPMAGERDSNSDD